MDDKEILQMVESGELTLDQISDFKDLDDEIQESVESGELTVEDALSIPC